MKGYCITLWVVLILASCVFCQNKPFPFGGPRRRVLPGQRSSGCADCAAELKQCVATCLDKFDCSEMNIKEGFCPVDDRRPENCSAATASFLNVCKTDTDCPGTKKCCQSACSKVCSSALPVPPNHTSRRNRPAIKIG